MQPLRGQANRPVHNTGRRTSTAPKHRNQLPEYHGPVPSGDEHNVRGFATAGSRVGGHIKGTRPDLG